jgi:hypothetical protein
MAVEAPDGAVCACAGALVSFVTGVVKSRLPVWNNLSKREIICTLFIAKGLFSACFVDRVDWSRQAGANKAGTDGRGWQARNSEASGRRVQEAGARRIMKTAVREGMGRVRQALQGKVGLWIRRVGLLVRARACHGSPRRQLKLVSARALSLLLVLVMITSSLPALAFADAGHSATPTASGDSASPEPVAALDELDTPEQEAPDTASAPQGSQGGKEGGGGGVFRHPR